MRQINFRNQSCKPRLWKSITGACNILSHMYVSIVTHSLADISFQNDQWHNSREKERERERERKKEEERRKERKRERKKKKKKTTEDQEVVTGPGRARKKKESARKSNACCGGPSCGEACRLARAEQKKTWTGHREERRRGAGGQRQSSLSHRCKTRQENTKTARTNSRTQIQEFVPEKPSAQKTKKERTLKKRLRKRELCHGDYITNNSA